MRQKSGPEKQPAEDAIGDIRRATRRHFSAEEKIRIVLEGLRGEESIAELCRAVDKEGRTVDFLLRAKRDVAAAKAFFRLAFRRQGRLPLKITLDGYQASHRAAKEALDEHPEGNQCKIRSSKYLNNLIEQDHRSVKLRLGPMLGLKHFRQAATTIAGIELMHRIRKGQFKLGRLGAKGNTAPKIWNAVLAA